MALSPKDILEKEFDTKFKGYDPQEVDLFLDEVMSELSTLNERNSSLEAKVRILEGQIAEYKMKEVKMSDAEDRIMSTVLAAQRNAQMYLSKVEVQAQGIMDGATKNAKTIIEGAQMKMENIRADLQKYESLVQEYKVSFKAFLDEQYSHMNARIDQSDIHQSVADITQSINKLQEDIEDAESQCGSIKVSDIISETAAPAAEPEVADPETDKAMDEIKILVDDIDGE